ncbi:MAG: methyltransferase domain-containing protein [Acidobacteriota bacterium]|nr:methyltransferase domain-containing protein [Acidobacteriota bacterium]
MNAPDNGPSHEDIMKIMEDNLWTREQVQRLANAFNLAPGQNLLDVGCGTGYLMRNFGSFVLRGGGVYGIDRDKQVAETAKQLADRFGFTDFRVFQGPAEELPFGNENFDCVMAQNLLGFVKQPGAVLDEMIRVTRPGGCIALFEPATDTADINWTNTYKLSLEERLLDRECAFVMSEGRAAMGDGRPVGNLVPGWLEQRGLWNVDIRANELVRWMAPPYRSPAQKQARKLALEHPDRNDEEALKAALGYLERGGADEALIERFKNLWQKCRDRFNEAVTEESAAYARGLGHLWCIWGFKPHTHLAEEPGDIAEPPPTLPEDPGEPDSSGNNGETISD